MTQAALRSFEVPVPAAKPVPVWLTRAAWAIAGLALLGQLVVLVHWLNTPILDQHAFRQTQTALTSFWLLRGSPFFAYWTPALGSPWSVPYEMPLYQGIVALVNRLGVPLDPAGRLVSEAFFLLCFWPLRMVWRDLRLPPLGLPFACALLLASPLYAFWSRTFMIESLAVFLGLLWLALFVRFMERGQAWVGGVALAAGVLASVAKSTTLPPFALLAGLYLLPRAWRWLRAGLPAREWPPMLAAAAILLLPFVAGFAWVAYCDPIKAANPIAKILTSTNMAAWNWGTPGQRFSRSLWSAVYHRIMPDIFGAAWPLAILALAWGATVATVGRISAAQSASPAGMADGASLMRPTVAALTLAFLSAFLLFPNLHTVHNYYQYANACFVIAALAIALAALAGRYPTAAALIVVVMLGSQLAHFAQVQLGWLRADPSHDPAYRIALLARDRLPPDGSMVVFGDDWEPTIPYYSERKTLDVPGWTDPAVFDDILRDPQAHLEGTQFAGVVSCTGRYALYDYSDEEKRKIDAFLAGRPVLAEAGACRLLGPAR